MTPFIERLLSRVSECLTSLSLTTFMLRFFWVTETFTCVVSFPLFCQYPSDQGRRIFTSEQEETND
jgi:hypothetical protein